MPVSLLNNSIYNSSKIKNNTVINTTNHIKNLSFKGDTFERSTKVGNVYNTRTIAPAEWDSSRVEAIYDEVYYDVMAQVPLSRELNITKPKFYFAQDNNKDLHELAGYVFSSNIMFFSPEICDDFFLCTAKDENGNSRGNFGIHDEKSLKKYYEAAQEYGLYMEPFKLNDTEKEVLIKTMMAHELRHCIQTHLIASTKDCLEPYKTLLVKAFENKMDTYKTACAELEEINRGLEALGFPKEENNIEPPGYSMIEYSDNFVPKKLIVDDTKLKFSLSPKDNRYLSTKEHLLSYMQAAADGLDVQHYQASPVEMDANNFAYEYYFVRLKNNPKYRGMRPVVADAIQNNFFNSTKTGMAAMEQFGYPSLIRK